MLNNLNKMLSDISKYKRNKDDLLEVYIKERLNKSLETYYNQLSSSLEYLVSKDGVKVLKNSDRI
jgi:NADH dehydrogenase FAD-containing subunit